MKLRLIAICGIAASLLSPAAVRADGVEVSGSMRLRFNAFLNADHDSDTDDSQRFTEMRTRVQFSAMAGSYGSVFVQMQDSRVLGEGGGSVSELDRVDLHQAYLKIRDAFGKPLALKLGRTTMAYGAQRQIGGLEWSNVGRAFDGAHAAYDFSEQKWIHFFAMKLAEQNGGASNPAETAFLGGYLHLQPNDETIAEAYLFDNYTDNGDLNDAGELVEGIGNVFTAGGRLEYRSESVKLYGEGAFQFGSTAESQIDSVTVSASLDMAAFAFVAGGRYDLPGDSPIWIGGEFNYASGDDDPSDTDEKTYLQLHPTGHAVLGYMDRVGWRNIQAITISAGYDVDAQWKFWSSFHLFQLAEPGDRWYGVTGAPVGGVAGDASFDSDLGNEWDLSARYSPDGALAFEGHFGLWLPGSWQEQATAMAGNGGDAAAAIASPADLDPAMTFYFLTQLSF